MTSVNISEKTLLSKTSRKRLLKDVVDIIKEPLTDNNIYYAHDDTNMLRGYAMILGPDDTIYRYGAYCFKFDFPTNYPFSPPKLTYLTNNGKTRFHPNLYRNGKVCISILNTWKGEQWTSCQTIKSILLTLVTLLHNKSLLNEPGINENHKSFISYHKIITFRNLQHSILHHLNKNNWRDLSCFSNIYINYIKKNKKQILDYIAQLSKANTQVLSTTIYNMKCTVNYELLLKKFNEVFTTL
jgi:ubiquitin-protein ligase